MKIPMRGGGYLTILRPNQRHRTRPWYWVKVTRVASDGLMSWSTIGRPRHALALAVRNRGKAERSAAHRARRGQKERSDARS